MQKKVSTARDRLESHLLKTYSNIFALSSEFIPIIEKFKDSSFGTSFSSYSLYSNGHNIRGESTNNKHGLIFHNNKNIFSIGFYHKELEPTTEGYLMIVAPRGEDAIKVVDKFIKKLSKDREVRCKGVYVRFLDVKQYIEFLKIGFLPVKENPWHPDSPEEDETFSCSIINLDTLLTSDKEYKIKTISSLSPNSRKKVKYAYNRFNNFLKRNKLIFRIEEFESRDIGIANKIIKTHFKMLREQGKSIGSTPEDHFNMTSELVMQNPKYRGFLGFINEVPVSFFAGEMLNVDKLALYTPFTLRDSQYISKVLKIPTNNDEDLTGFTAISTYAFIKLFIELHKKGIKQVDLGGSELADLNRFKRQLGARPFPTYWVYKPIF